MARAASLTIASSLTLRIRYLAKQIHDLGPKPLFEAMCEIASGADPITTFETFGALPADFVREHNGHDLPPNFQVIK